MNSNGTGFYITLPSDSSKGLFPENNPSEYVTSLSQWIELNGEWEVGLHSVAYTQWNIIKHLNEPILCTAISRGKTIKYEIVLVKKYYTTIDEYITDINESIKKLFKKEGFDETRYIKFSIANGKVTITSSHFTIYLRKEQAVVLGFMKFDDPEEVKKITAGLTYLFTRNSSAILEMHEVREIGLRSFFGCWTIFVFGRGITSAFFQRVGRRCSL